MSTKQKLSCICTNIMKHLEYFLKRFTHTYTSKKPHWWLIDSEAQENMTFQEKSIFHTNYIVNSENLRELSTFGYIRSD